MIQMLRNTPLLKPEKLVIIQWSSNFHQRIHKCPPVGFTHSQVTPTNTLRSYFFISFNNMLSRAPNISLSVTFPDDNFPRPTHATRPGHFMLLYFITLLMFSQEQCLRSLYMSNFLHCPVTSFLSGTNNLLATHPQ
jgi:hypothetical protein